MLSINHFKTFVNSLVGPFSGHTAYEPDSSGLQGVDIPPVKELNVENSKEKRDRALVHLLRLNHHAHAVLYENLTFHNHFPHYLGSAYLLGADEKRLHEIYDIEDGELTSWKPSPSEVTEEDWQDFLGNARYQRAFLDYFEDEVAAHGYDWKTVVAELLVVGKKPLINALYSSLAHPVIHLGYALELNSREVAMEALCLAASCYDFLADFLIKDPPPPSADSSTSPLKIIYQVRNESAFDGDYKPSDQNWHIVHDHMEAFQKYFNMLDIQNCEPNELLRELIQLSSLMLVTTHKRGNPQFDFFICHAVTSAYALRTILPFLRAKYHMKLLRSHWLFVLAVYILQLRPQIKPDLVDEVQLNGRGWDYVTAKALGTGEKEIPDTHYMKALRMFKETASLFKDDEDFYLKSAVKLADEYSTWIGFENSKDTLEIRK